MTLLSYLLATKLLAYHYFFFTRYKNDPTSWASKAVIPISKPICVNRRPTLICIGTTTNAVSSTPAYSFHLLSIKLVFVDFI